MRVKVKICKGKGKALGFDACGIDTLGFKFGLCYNCYKKWLFGTEEGKAFVAKNSLRAKKNVSFTEQKAKAKEKRERRFELKTYAQRVQEARRVFQAWIRHRDRFDACVSCNNPNATKWDASHFMKAETYSALIFHEDNVNRSCVYCNKHLDGNLIPYRQNLIKKIGIERVEYLESFPPNKVFRYSNEELQSIIKKYKL